MMKKLFTFLTLLLCVVVGRAADVYKSDFTDGQVIMLTKTYVDENSGDGKWITKNTTSTKSVQPTIDPETETDYVTKPEKTDYYQVKQEATRFLTFRVTGVTKVTIFGCGSDNRDIKASYGEFTGNDAKVLCKGNTFGTISGLNSAESYAITIWATNDTPIYAIKVKTSAVTSPEFTATVPNSQLTLKSAPSPFPASAASGTFSLSGENLTPGTYDFVKPSVSGTLTISPAQITVPAGGILASTDFTVTYAGPGTDVDATDASITATIDGEEVEIPINYRAKAAYIAQTQVSEAITWDWADVSGSDRSAYDDALVYANYDEFTFAPTFDATKLVVYASPNMHTGGAFRLGKISFTTTVPGTIAVDFSDTGNKSGSGAGTKRYLKVNGEVTEHYTNREEGDDSNKNHKQTGKVVEVPAGEVTIESSASYIQLYKIVFTPSVEVLSVGAQGYATYTPTADLVAGSVVSAYKASVSGDVITFTKVSTLKAGEGYLLAGAANASETVSFGAAEPPTGNLLVGVTEDIDALATADGANTNYILNVGAQGIGFYKAAGQKVAAGKAYLRVPSGVRQFVGLDLDADDVTGISGVQQTAPADGKLYNLQGQRVLVPQSGLYIVNGKKVIIK